MDDFIPAIGRTVVYCYPLDREEWTGAITDQRAYEGPVTYRPAQIVRVFADTGFKACNIVVFLDGSNDSGIEMAASGDRLSVWKTSVLIADDLAVAQPHRYYPRVPPDA